MDADVGQCMVSVQKSEKVESQTLSACRWLHAFKNMYLALLTTTPQPTQWKAEISQHAAQRA